MKDHNDDERRMNNPLLETIKTSYQGLLDEIELVLRRNDIHSSPDIILWLFVSVVVLGLTIILPSAAAGGHSSDPSTLSETRKSKSSHSSASPSTTTTETPAKTNSPESTARDGYEGSSASTAAGPYSPPPYPPSVPPQSPDSRSPQDLSTASNEASSSPRSAGAIHRGKVRKSGLFGLKSHRTVELVCPAEDPHSVLLVYGYADKATGSPDTKRAKNMWLSKSSGVAPHKDGLSFTVHQLGVESKDGPTLTLHCGTQAEAKEWVAKIEAALKELT